MNFKKLQAMQEELDNAILAEKPEMTAEERFNKTLVALSVEIAEIANCAEHFKFWKDNKGKVDEKRFLDSYNSSGRKDGMYYDKNNKEMGLTRQQAHKLTLVEECSDTLHFILSLANQTGVDFSSKENEKVIDEIKIKGCFYSSLENDYLSLINIISSIDYFINVLEGKNRNIVKLLGEYLNYVRHLGITTEELEQAYYDKNEINYKRLREGY